MSGRKQARTKSPVAPRIAVKSLRPDRAERKSPPNAKVTSAESIATSIMDLMMLAADARTPNKFDAGHADTSATRAALARLIVRRFGDDD
jgi:hypothetical protein